MITLVDSPGDPLANSYVSLTFADEHMAQSIGRTDWVALDDEIKKAALIEATRTLDSMFTWFAISTTPEQALDHPQSGLYDKFGRRIPDDIVAKPIKLATCDLAYSIYSYGSTTTPNSKVDSVKVGPITLNLDQASSERFFEGVDFQSLAIFGDFHIKRTGSAYNVKVYR